MEQYISKDALVAEITHKIKVLEAFIKNFDGISDKVEKAKNKIEALSDELLFLDTLEVKDVDFEKEIEQSFIDLDYHLDTYNRVEDYVGENIDMVEYKRIAKYFIELGLKAQKGE